MAQLTMAEARRRNAELRAAGLLKRRNPLEKAAEHPRSLRAAINGKCYDCVGQDADPNWRDSIRSCDIESCTLHPVRPFQDPSHVDN